MRDPGRDFLYRRMASEARGDLFVKATCLENSDGIKCYVHLHDMYIYLKEKKKSARAGFEPATNASIIVTELYTPLYQPS